MTVSQFNDTSKNKNGMVLNIDIYIQHIHHIYIFKYKYIITVNDLSLH